MDNTHKYRESDWLPTTAKEIAALGWDRPDVILFNGDAYIDHPSFGAAVIGRVLESQGLKVAIVPQPNWRDDLRDFKKLGVPRLFFAVTAGSMDSMVNHYTANKRLRSNDAYTADGRAGQRPDYATNVYCNIIKDLYPDVPLVIGGIEASLRRFVHYDYWSDKLMPGILYSSKADILVYGMGEKSMIEIARRIEKGESVKSMTDIPQTAVLLPLSDLSSIKKDDDIMLSSFERCLKDKIEYAKDFRVIEEESNRWKASRMLQCMNDKVLLVNSQWEPMSQPEVDGFFDLPYTRLPHPRYKNKVIPAYEMIRHSVNMHRGCFGGCSFCTISAHQGKFIVSRSAKSIEKEVDAIIKMPDFRGYISDLGGPSANMYNMRGKDSSLCQKCKRPSCIYPNVCNNMNTDHSSVIDIYRKVSEHEGIKKAFVGSGIRYDLLLNYDKPSPDKYEYIKQLIRYHVSGRLKVAPEHTSDNVLKMMRKPPFNYFRMFNKIFIEENKAAGLNQQLIPYFISSHPGSTKRDMAKLMLDTKELNFKLEQVQDFTPTPMTLSTAIYYSGVNPYTLEPVYTAHSQQEKQDQRKFFFWYKPELKREIDAELRQMGLLSNDNPAKRSANVTSGGERNRSDSDRNSSSVASKRSNESSKHIGDRESGNRLFSKREQPTRGREFGKNRRNFK